MRHGSKLLTLTVLLFSPSITNLANAEAFNQATALSDAELGEQTGKFILPNGAEIALTVISQTAVNDQLVLRSVFRIGATPSVEVFGRTKDEGKAYPMPPASTVQATGPTGVSVNFDRQSGTRTITPTFSAAVPTTVTLGGGAEGDPATWGLSAIPIVAGAATTIDGTVTLSALPRGTLVTLQGDQFTVSQLVGNAIATAVSNSANDRTIDTVTNVNIDLRDISVYTTGSAALRVESLALDAARGMVR